MSCYYLVLLETSGNQNYIFSTNRLRENIGASELTYQAGTYWVIEAVAIQNKEVLFKDWRNPEKLRYMLRHNNPALEKSNRQAEIIVAASGKSLVLTKDKETAQAIISHVTKKALKETPGLDIAGVYEKIEKENSLANAIRQIHKTFEKTRSRRPSPESRFLRLPIIADCAVSGLPASEIDTLGKEPKAISKVSAIKRDTAKEAKERLGNLDQRLPNQIDQLLKPEEENQEEKRSWLAVVHADGNGLGQIFLNFEHYIGEDKSNRNYIKKYREFSLALDECTEAAFKEALDVFPVEENQNNQKRIPIVPLIIGGDDLTVVCDGHYALEFTRIFLEEFEKQTKTHESIKPVAKLAFEVERLSACAGIAVVKRHFPFSVAYHLAEQLIKSAKEVKTKVTKKEDKNIPFPCSAIDFHILHDSSEVELDKIRSTLNPEAKIHLYNRPYMVTKLDQIKTTENGQKWVEKHQWNRLRDRAKALKNKQITSSQSHAIRTALFANQGDAQYKLIQVRFPNLKNTFEESEESIFYQNNEGISVTSFLDALDAMDFLKTEKEMQHESNATI